MKTVEYPTDNCPSCGNENAFVHTDAEQDDNAPNVNDGDVAYCTLCNFEGYVSVEDSECADVIWNDLNMEHTNGFKN